MPYTLEELKKLTWYQDLIDADEQQYLQRKSLLSEQADYSGSANDGSLLLRNESNTVLLFEDPYLNQLPEDESTKIIHNTTVKLLKNKESDLNTINSVLDRTFREL